MVKTSKWFSECTERNATYTSKDAAVEFVEEIGQWVEESLLKRLHQAPFYSLMADECTDISVVEELSIFCRWVEDGLPVEHFMGILPLKKASVTCKPDNDTLSIRYRNNTSSSSHESYNSHSDSDSDDSFHDTSPITSEKEYSTSGSSDESESDTPESNSHPPMTSPDQQPPTRSLALQGPGSHYPTVTLQRSSTLCANKPSSTGHGQTLYCLCGDNIDKTVKKQYMRTDTYRTGSIHYFHSYAVADRIDFSDLSETILPLPRVDLRQLATSPLPSPLLCHTFLLVILSSSRQHLMVLLSGISSMNANEIGEHLPASLRRATDLAKEKGSSIWLTAVPLVEHRFAFHDALALRYGWTPSEMPSTCTCGSKFSVENALSCARGGFPQPDITRSAT